MNSKILALTRLEFRLAWNGFRLRAKSPPNLVLYILMLSACISVNYLLTVSLNLSAEKRTLALSSLRSEGISPYLMTFSVLTILFAYSVVRGLYRKLSTVEFKGPDLDFLGSAPIRSHEVFIAKSVKAIIKRLLFSLIAVATFLTPIMSFFRMTADRGIVLMSAILLYVCFLYLIEAFTFFTSRIAMNSTRVSKVTALLVMPVAASQVFSQQELLDCVKYEAFLPSTTISRIVYFSLFRSASLSIATFSILSFLALLSGLSLVVLALSVLYYERLETLEEVVKPNWLKFLRNRLKWSLGSRHSPLIAIFFKEFWTNLRASHVSLIITSYAILLPIFILNLDGLTLGLSTWLPISSFALAFSMLLFSAFFQPALDLFLAEREKSWIVKVAPISMENVVLAKYLYSIILSLIGLLPPLVGVSSLAPFLPERLVLAVSSVPLLLLTSAIGIYIGAHYTPSSLREEFPATGIWACLGLIMVLGSPIALVPILFVSRPIVVVSILAFALDYAIFLSHMFLKAAARKFCNRDAL